VIPVEVQVWRNLKPRTRPGIVQFDEGRMPYGARLFTGRDDSEGIVWVRLSDGKPYVEDWWTLSIQLFIDSVPLSSPRPAVLYTRPIDVPCCIVQFPTMAPPENRILGGWHSVTLRRAS